MTFQTVGIAKHGSIETPAVAIKNCRSHESQREAPLQQIKLFCPGNKAISAGRHGVLVKVCGCVKQHPPPNNGSDNDHSPPSAFC